MTGTDRVEAVARAIASGRNARRVRWGGPEADIGVMPVDFDDARAALAANDAHLAEQGLVVVPREPTEGMKNQEGVHWEYGCQVCGGLKEGWQAMIAAYQGEGKDA